MLDAGCSMLDAGFSMLDAGFSMLDARYWILDAGYLILISGGWSPVYVPGCALRSHGENQINPKSAIPNPQSKQSPYPKSRQSPIRNPKSKIEKPAPRNKN